MHGHRLQSVMTKIANGCAVAVLLPLAACAEAGSAAGPSPNPSTPAPTSQGPDSSLVAIADETAAYLPHAPRHPVRIADDAGLDDFLASLEEESDSSLAADLRAQISRVPEGEVLVGGIVAQGCDIPGSAALEQSGDRISLVATDLPATPRPECVAAVTTVAIVAVDFDDVPPTSTSPGDLEYFSRISAPADSMPVAVELTDDQMVLLATLAGLGVDDVPDLAALQADDRRFAFVLSGCDNNAAELFVSFTRITAELTADEPTESLALCEAPEIYLAVIDVSADLIPSMATPGLR